MAALEEVGEDVTFLPGDEDQSVSSQKRRQYAGLRLGQIECSKRRACLISLGVALVILAIALIAAFAHPEFITGKNNDHQPETNSNEQVKPTAAVATNGEPFPWKDIKLPTNISPESYNIYLNPDIKKSSFQGSVKISLAVNTDTHFILLHIRNLTITKWKLTTSNNKELSILKRLENANHQQYYMKVSETLLKGSLYVLELSFQGKFVDSALAGFYKSTYKNEKREARYLATTQFEPTDARAAFPCFDEPAFKANFSLVMVRDPKLHNVTLFNMPQKGPPKDIGNGLVEDHFETSVKMSTYLVAFIVCDFAKVTQLTKSGTIVSVYSAPHQISKTQFALEAAVKILEYYETFFGIPYPLKKQDLVAIPDFSAGAMENWGLVTYRETTLLYNESVSSEHNKNRVAVVIAHELAHQWFGNLVTMQWWNDLWLNEGFASYVEYIGTDIIKKDWKMFDQFTVDSWVRAMNLDSHRNSHPISVPVNDPGQINQIFDTISYDKGACLIQMVKDFIGMDKLQEGLQAYLKKYQFGNAETKDLWSALSESSKIDVTKVMDTWTSQMGYPVVALTKTGDKISASQTRFLINPDAKPSTEFQSPYGYKWEVPLTYTSNKHTASQNKTLEWMHVDGKTVDLKFPSPPDWIKVNVGQQGFYRVNYHTEGWSALMNLLKTNHKTLSASERAGLLDDAFSFARSGLLPMDTAMDMTEYLDMEEDYVPWRVVLGQFKYIETMLWDYPEAFDKFKDYVLQKMNPRITALGWNGTDNVMEEYLRSAVLGHAVVLGHNATVAEVKKKFAEWTDGKDIPTNLKDVIYLGGVMYGGEEEWTICWNHYLKEPDATEKKRLLSAMAAVKNTDILHRYLHNSLQTDLVRSQDTVDVLQAVIKHNPSSNWLAVRFAEENWDFLFKRYNTGSFQMGRLIKGLTADLHTQLDYEEIDSFFKTHPIGSAQRTVQQALENIQVNIKWVKDHKEHLVAWLDKKGMNRSMMRRHLDL